MNTLRMYATIMLLLSAAGVACAAEPTELEVRNEFLKAYNWKKANERLASLGYLTQATEDYSYQMLFLVSWKDPDPEVRSRAFTILCKRPDKVGYVAYLAAASFREERELGVKIEKATAMAGLKYRWSALNELVNFLKTLRWYHDWYWWNTRHPTGYIAGGTPPGEPGSGTESGGGSKEGRAREPQRWRSERELMQHVCGVINKLANTNIESRPRIDQEIVKWWERKSDLWEDYDRKLRTQALGIQKEPDFGEKLVRIKPEVHQPQEEVDEMEADIRKFLEAQKKEEPARAAVPAGTSVKDLE
ncbi:MAG: hypothetical protein KIS92_02035 [Planctomycetota bacterium]|nr:hypothetical protein [Planctomycetota bacterium]